MLGTLEILLFIFRDKEKEKEKSANETLTEFEKLEAFNRAKQIM